MQLIDLQIHSIEKHFLIMLWKEIVLKICWHTGSDYLYDLQRLEIRYSSFWTLRRSKYLALHCLSLFYGRMGDEKNKLVCRTLSLFVFFIIVNNSFFILAFYLFLVSLERLWWHVEGFLLNISIVSWKVVYRHESGPRGYVDTLKITDWMLHALDFWITKGIWWLLNSQKSRSKCILWWLLS